AGRADLLDGCERQEQRRDREEQRGEREGQRCLRPEQRAPGKRDAAPGTEQPGAARGGDRNMRLAAEPAFKVRRGDEHWGCRRRKLPPRNGLMLGGPRPSAFATVPNARALIRLPVWNRRAPAGTR